MAGRRLARVQARVLKCCIPPDNEAQRDLALCIIDAQNTWSLFRRFFFISCMLGARRYGGGRTTTMASGINTAEDAIRFAVLTL